MCHGCLNMKGCSGFVNNRDLLRCSMWASFKRPGSALCKVKDRAIGRKDVAYTSAPGFMDVENVWRSLVVSGGK